MRAVALSQRNAQAARSGGLGEVDLTPPLTILGFTVLGLVIVVGGGFILFKAWRKGTGSRGTLYGLWGRRRRGRR
jgi:hypothetical protein